MPSKYPEVDLPSSQDDILHDDPWSDLPKIPSQLEPSNTGWQSIILWMFATTLIGGLTGAALAHALAEGKIDLTLRELRSHTPISWILGAPKHKS